MNSRKRTAKPSTKYANEDYVLVQFVSDGVREVVTSDKVSTSDEGGVWRAQYIDGHFYDCFIISRNEDKDSLMKLKMKMSSGMKQTKQSKQKPKAVETVKSTLKEKVLKNSTKKKEASTTVHAKKASVPNVTGSTSMSKARQDTDLNLLSQMKSCGMFVPHAHVQQQSTPNNEDRSRMAHDSTINEYTTLHDYSSIIDDSDSNESISTNYSGNTSGFRDMEIESVSRLVNNAPMDPTTTPTLTRPTSGKKCPRKRPLQGMSACGIAGPTQEKRACVNCKELERKIRVLELANEDLKMEIMRLESSSLSDNSSTTCTCTYSEPAAPPRPGCLSQELAKKHNMVELSPGTSVFLYGHLMEKAMRKNTATATVLFLLSCFYKSEELTGSNLTGKNGKNKLDEGIINSIIAYTMKLYPVTKESALKTCIRNKITAIEATRKQKGKNE